MKRRILELFLITVAFCVFAFVIKITYAEPLDTYHGAWNLIRETADEDGADFASVYDLTGVGTTAGDFASKDSNTVASGGPFRILPKNAPGGYGMPVSQGSKWQFIICGSNYNNVDDTFSFDVVGWGRDNGPLQKILEGDGVLGTQAVVIYPDGGDALGALVSETAVTYTHGSTKFTVTNSAFADVVAGMLARVTGTDLTNEIVQVTTATDDNNIVCSGVTSTDNNTDSTVQINPAFWVDTITLDATTKWPKQQGDLAGIAVYNSGANQICILEIQFQGIEWVQFIVYDADAATNEEAGNITVFGRPN